MKMARELTWDGKSHDGKASTIAAVNRTNGGICQSGKGGTQRKRKRWGFIDAKLTREEIDIGHSSVHDAQVTIDACNENKETATVQLSLLLARSPITTYKRELTLIPSLQTRIQTPQYPNFSTNKTEAKIMMALTRRRKLF